MASDSSEDEAFTVRLPTELEEWLDARAADLDVDRETVLVQLVASYRAAADLDGEVAGGEDPGVDVAGPEAVRDVVEPSVEAAAAAAVEDALEDRVANEVEDALAGRLEAVADAVEERLAERVADVESEFQGKLEDVRERVVQVKREADAKAPADHDHEELARIDAVAGRVDELEEGMSDLEEALAALEADREEGVADLEADLAEVRERLQTVAWVVSDLRDAYESKGSAAALEHIRREAAAADVSRARCERCGEGVEIGLLTEPACPHCDATVTNVAPASGFFGKPQLLVASQLEAGDDG